MPSRSVRRIGIAALALVAVDGFALTSCSSDDSNPLFATDWTLTSAVDSGVPVDTSKGLPIHWRFLQDGGCGDTHLTCPDGQKLVGNDVCNDFVRDIQVDGDRVVWGTHWESTAVGCSGGLAETLRDFFFDASFQYVVTGDQLKLTSSDGTIDLALHASHAS